MKQGFMVCVFFFLFNTCIIFEIRHALNGMEDSQYIELYVHQIIYIDILTQDLQFAPSNTYMYLSVHLSNKTF